jgi:hypothetical protein
LPFFAALLEPPLCRSFCVEFTRRGGHFAFGLPGPPFPPMSSLAASDNTRPASWAAKCCQASVPAVRAPSPCRFGSLLPGPRSPVPVPSVRAVHVSRISAK